MTQSTKNTSDSRLSMNNKERYCNIECKTLEDFIKENGECVLGYENGEMTIEIYDTYRE